MIWFTYTTTGDEIFITSTDYRWDQVEDFTIIECSDCPPKFIRLDRTYSKHFVLSVNVEWNFSMRQNM